MNVGTSEFRAPEVFHNKVGTKSYNESIDGYYFF